MTDDDLDFLPWDGVELYPSFQHGENRWYVPHVVYADSMEAAKQAAMIHLGWTLMERGLRCTWLKGAGS